MSQSDYVNTRLKEIYETKKRMSNATFYWNQLPKAITSCCRDNFQAERISENGHIRDASVVNLKQNTNKSESNHDTIELVNISELNTAPVIFDFTEKTMFENALEIEALKTEDFISISKDIDSSANFSLFNMKFQNDTQERKAFSNDIRRKLPSNIWTKEEDILLLKLSQSKLSNRWKKISKIIGTKTASQCTYRLKLLAKTKIDLNSPDTTKELISKVKFPDNEKNQLIHQLITNADKKSRRLGIKLSNVTKLFGVIKEDDVNKNKENIIGREVSKEMDIIEHKQSFIGLKASMNSQNFVYRQGTDSTEKTSDTDMKSSYERMATNENPFMFLRKSSPTDIQIRANSKELKEGEENFLKEYNRTFYDDAKRPSYENYEKEQKDAMLIDIENRKNATKRNSSSGLGSGSLTSSGPYTGVPLVKVSKRQEEYSKILDIVSGGNPHKKLLEIKNHLEDSHFDNLQTRIKDLSGLLVEINIIAQSSSTKEDQLLCIELQSKILNYMINETKKQLITDDGDRLLA